MCRNGLLHKTVAYMTVGAIVAFCMVYWSASAGDLKSHVTPTQLTSASDVANRIHKTDRLYVISFAERWSAVPRASTGTQEQSQRETARGEKHIEKIPFSCEFAFSRLVKAGNFNTRCMATADPSIKLAAATPRDY